MRFKELRGFAFAIILVILELALLSVSAFTNNRSKLIIAAIIGFVVLFNIISQYYVRVMEDCIMIYVMVGIFLLPKLIDYKDIKGLTLKSGKHLVIETELKDYHVYVFKAQKIHDYILKRI